MDQVFKKVLNFHGCYCLDIAMGYRVAKALQREMDGQLENSKQVVAHVGNATCAVDAIQFLLGCTVGKRNLIFADTGKPVYILQNTDSGEAVRIYVSYWDSFDQSHLKALKQQANSKDATEHDKQKLKDFLDQQIDFILSAGEDQLFRVENTDVDAPAISGKFETQACACCGEFTKLEKMASQEGKAYCRECL